MFKISIDYAKCSSCGNCAKACPPEIVVFDTRAVVKEELTEECLGCQSCVVVCSEKAITVEDFRS